MRRALSHAIDRRPLIQYLWRNFARPAYSVLPPESWAYSNKVAPPDYNPEKARQLLDAAGYPATNGVRFHLTFKTSTEESSRLMAAVTSVARSGAGNTSQVYVSTSRCELIGFAACSCKTSRRNPCVLSRTP